MTSGIIAWKYWHKHTTQKLPVQWLEKMIPGDIHWIPNNILFKQVESMSSSLRMWSQAAQHLHVWYKQQWGQQISTPTYKLEQRCLQQDMKNYHHFIGEKDCSLCTTCNQQILKLTVMWEYKKMHFINLIAHNVGIGDDTASSGTNIDQSVTTILTYATSIRQTQLIIWVAAEK